VERWSSAALAVVASLSFAGSCGERETTTERSSPTPTRSPESSPPRLVIDHATFMPDVKPEGETVELAVTFPDGSSATLRYPEALGLARMGAQPDVAYVWTRDPPPRFPLLFFYGSPPASGISTGTGPVGHYVSPQGERLELWRGTIGESDAQYWLVYRLPSWTVVASVKDAAAAEEVAAALHVAEVDSGFVVASGRGPIRLADGFGEGEGPQLASGTPVRSRNSSR
jgi:hypothetical protein